MDLLRDFAVDAEVNERSSQRFRHTPGQSPLYGMTLANQRRAGRSLGSCPHARQTPSLRMGPNKNPLSPWALVVGEGIL